MYGFLFASYKVKADAEVAGWRMLVAIFMGAWIVEAFGAVAVAVGVFSVILHLSLLAFKAFIGVDVLIILCPFLSVVIAIVVYVVKEARRAKSGQQTTQEHGVPLP